MTIAFRQLHFFLVLIVESHLRQTYHLFHYFRYCNIFPSVNVKGTIKHLQLLPHELERYEVQMDTILKRYIRRLQWLLSGKLSITSSLLSH